MNTFRNPEPSALSRGLALFLCLAITLAGCGHSVIQVRPPYHQKLRIGDGVKITVGDGTLHAGRVVYVDKSIIVIRTPRQTITNHPVKSARWLELELPRFGGVFRAWASSPCLMLFFICHR